MKFSVCLVLLVAVWQASAQAPGDESGGCVSQRGSYPPNISMLMDSRNYEQLITGSGAVWQALDVDRTGSGWRSSFGGLCAAQLRSCDFREGRPQDNWLFTQYINYINATELFVNITANFQECRLNSACTQLYVDMYRYERNGVDATAARTTTNYQLVRRIEQPSGFSQQQYITSFSFTPSGNTNGFYLGVRDTGTCVNILRLQVYYSTLPQMLDATTPPPTPTPPASTIPTLTTPPSTIPTPTPTPSTTPAATTPPPTALTGCPTQNHHPLFPGSGISYNWTDTAAGSSQTLSCSGLRLCQEMAGVSGGMIIHRCSALAEWLSVDFSGCGLSVTTLQLCEASQQIASDAESAAMVIVNITANASEFEVPAIIVATSIVEELTAAAIDQPEVRANYLQLIDNLLEAIPDSILESQQQANTSTRLLHSLRRFANTVPIPANSTNNTLAFPLDNFALLLRDINPESFSGESFSVNLGSVEEAIRNSSGITEEVLVTMMDPLPNATASVELPQSLFDGSTAYVLPWQRIVYSIFLANSLFLTLDTNCENFAIGSIILGVDVNSSVTNISMSTGEIQLAFQQFRMSCDDQTPVQSTAMCSNFAREGQYGRWSMDSCRVVSDDGVTTHCVCTQLGHFGLLFDLDPGDVYAPGAIFLAAVTYVGTIISVLCLVVTVITYTAFKKHHSSAQGSAGIHGQLLINLSCSLIGVYVTFIVAGLVTTVPPLCGVVAALLQYFMLVFFGWTAVEALFLYQKLVRNVLGQISRYFVPIAAAVVWLVPIVVVGISAGAGYQHYVNPFYCRIIMYPFWFGLIFPCVAVYLFNWAMFIIIIVCLVKNRKNVSSLHHKKKRELKRLFFLVLGLSLVFGLGWGFGLLATSSDIKELTFTFQILFSILIGSQGLLIFVFHVIRAPQARKQWKKLFIKLSCNKSLRSYSVSSSKSPKTSYPMPSINLLGKSNSIPDQSGGGQEAVSIN